MTLGVKKNLGIWELILLKIPGSLIEAAKEKGVPIMTRSQYVTKYKLE